MNIDVLYVFESTKFTTAGKIESVLLVSNAAPGPVGTEVPLEPGVYRITEAATVTPATGPTFLVSQFDKGNGLPDPPAQIVGAFTSGATTPAMAMAKIKKALAGQGTVGRI
jgi:hypothetical protein